MKQTLAPRLPRLRQAPIVVTGALKDLSEAQRPELVRQILQVARRWGQRQNPYLFWIFDDFCSKKMVLWGKRREHYLLTRGFSLRYGIFWKSINLGEPQDLAGKYGCSPPKVKNIRVFKDLIPTWVCWETPQNMLFDGDDHTDSLKSRILKEPIGTVLVFGPLKPQAKVMRQEDVEVNLQQCNMCITAFGRMTRWQDAVDVFSTMSEMRVLPDVISYNATIHALKASWQKALDLFAEMPTNGACGSPTRSLTTRPCRHVPPAGSGRWP